MLKLERVVKSLAQKADHVGDARKGVSRVGGVTGTYVGNHSFKTIVRINPQNTSVKMLSNMPK